MINLNKKNNKKKWFVYMLECSDKSFYFGITTDLKRRENEHNGLDIKIKKDGTKTKSKGAKYTKNKRPVKIIYFEEFLNRIEATKREYVLKQLKRKDKELLLKKNNKSSYIINSKVLGYKTFKPF